MYSDDESAHNKAYDSFFLFHRFGLQQRMMKNPNICTNIFCGKQRVTLNMVCNTLRASIETPLFMVTQHYSAGTTNKQIDKNKTTAR